MRYLLILFLLVPMTANAEMWLWVNKANNEVKSFSNEDDARVDSEIYKLYKLPGSYENYPLRHPADRYKYINGKFVENIDKISAIENERILAEEKAQEYELIKHEMEQEAIKKLKVKGVTLKHYKED